MGNIVAYPVRVCSEINLFHVLVEQLEIKIRTIDMSAMCLHSGYSVAKGFINLPLILKRMLVLTNIPHSEGGDF